MLVSFFFLFLRNRKTLNKYVYEKKYVFGCVLAVCLFACSEDVTLEVNTEDKTGYESLTDEEEHAYAGCVPVAISQILSFHKYPVKFGNTIVNWLEITRYPSVDLLREHGYLARGRIVYQCRASVCRRSL